MDAWIKDAIIDKAYSLRETLNGLIVREYHSEAPRELISALLEVVDVVIRYHETLVKSNAEETDFIRLSLFLSHLHGFLDEIKTVEISDIPVEMLPFLEKTMEKYDDQSMIYLKPTKDYNYTYINNLNYIYTLAERALGHKRESKKRIATISFPLSEKNNVLLHCIFSHEIGHHFDDIFLIRDKVIPRIEIDKKSLGEIVERMRRKMAETKKEINGKPVSLDHFVEIEEMKARYVENYINILANCTFQLFSIFII